MNNPFTIIEEFEQAICEYAGAPYAVAVNSCSNALFLCLTWYPATETLILPKRTYVSVPMAAIHGGWNVAFEDLPWDYCYRLRPTPIWDCARLFYRNMYSDLASVVTPVQFLCVSFHWTKPLGIQHGGAILHNHPEADEWLRRARFDGRLPGESAEQATMIGWHCLTTPEVAAAGLVRLASLPDNPPPMPPVEYPDLSLMEIFR